jgi:hypothetical protein
MVFDGKSLSSHPSGFAKGGGGAFRVVQPVDKQDHVEGGIAIWAYPAVARPDRGVGLLVERDVDTSQRDIGALLPTQTGEWAVARTDVEYVAVWGGKLR